MYRKTSAGVGVGFIIAGLLTATVPATHLVPPNDPLYLDQWEMRRVEANLAWHYNDGAPGLIIAMIDAEWAIGHPDLDGSIWVNDDLIDGVDSDGNGHVDDRYGWNFDCGTNDVHTPTSSDDHGTATAGPLAAEQNNGLGMSGIAYNAKLMLLRVKECNPAVSITRAYADALRYAVTNGSKIISSSTSIPYEFSNPTDNAFLNETITWAVQEKGALIFQAVGNINSAVKYPATHPDVVAVAATDEDNDRAYFSNFGPEVDISAPGTNITVTAFDVVGGQYVYSWDVDVVGLDPIDGKDGTSYATPLAAGIAALVWSAKPSLTNAQVRSHLESTASVLSDSGMGHGLINARRAVCSALGIPLFQCITA